VRIRGEAVWAGLGVTEWSVIPCDVSVTDASLICLAEFERKTATGALHPLQNRLTLALRSALGVTP